MELNEKKKHGAQLESFEDMHVRRTQSPLYIPFGWFELCDQCLLLLCT